MQSQMNEGEGAADAPPPQTLAIGEVVADKYRIERLLGAGGMAEVYAAINIRTDRHVALKWILPALAASPEVLARFRREALAAGRINHPNVVTIFDVVEHQGSACLVMELLAGETLAERMKRTGPMAFVEAVAIMLPAMRGVAAAHAHGVIHRDLKPDNIFLCMDADGSMRDCKVLDFGVSKLTVADAATTGDITLSGNVVGTPEYMAPEQVRAGKHADHRIDIYSLGVVFYEMLAGRPPFVGEHFSGLMLDIMQRDPPPLHTLRDGRPAAPGRRDSPGARARSRPPVRRHADVHHGGRGCRPGRAEAPDGDAGGGPDHAARDAAADAGRPAPDPQGSARHAGGDRRRPGPGRGRHVAVDRHAPGSAGRRRHGRRGGTGARRRARRAAHDRRARRRPCRSGEPPTAENAVAEKPRGRETGGEAVRPAEAKDVRPLGTHPTHRLGARAEARWPAADEGRACRRDARQGIIDTVESRDASW